MNTFRNKQFKNELDPKYASYDSLNTCEIKISSEKSPENCLEKCYSKSKKNIQIKKIKRVLQSPK